MICRTTTEFVKLNNTVTVKDGQRQNVFHTFYTALSDVDGSSWEALPKVNFFHTSRTRQADSVLS